MNSDRHGVCLIINNKTFKGKTKRTGTDRDEENLVETWRYLGYHVEVHRDMNFQKTINIFGNIDDLLSGRRQMKNPSWLTTRLSVAFSHMAINLVSLVVTTKKYPLNTLKHHWEIVKNLVETQIFFSSRLAKV